MIWNHQDNVIIYCCVHYFSCKDWAVVMFPLLMKFFYFGTFAEGQNEWLWPLQGDEGQEDGKCFSSSSLKQLQLQKCNHNVANHVFFPSAEEQDYQAWGEEAAEGGSKEVNDHTNKISCLIVRLWPCLGFFIGFKWEKKGWIIFDEYFFSHKRLSGVFFPLQHPW